MNDQVTKNSIMIRSLLSDAALQIRTSAYHSDFTKLMGENQFAAALELLGKAGQLTTVNFQYWQTLKRVAGILDLNVEYKEYNRKFQKARTAAAQATKVDGI